MYIGIIKTHEFSDEIKRFALKSNKMFSIKNPKKLFFFKFLYKKIETKTLIFLFQNTKVGGKWKWNKKSKKEFFYKFNIH